MRVSESIKHRTVQRDINIATQRMNDLSAKIASGKKFSRVSQDPISATLSEDYRTALQENASLQRKFVSDRDTLVQMEKATDQMLELLVNAKQKGLEGANSFISDDAAQAIGYEIEHLSERLMELGNQKAGKTYLFGGAQTLTAPLKEGNSISEAVVTIEKSRLKASKTFTGIEQEAALPQILEGKEIVFNLRNKSSNEEIELQFTTGRNTSVRDIVDQVNTAAAAEYFNAPDATSATGYRQNLRASIGGDGHFYLDVRAGYTLEGISGGDALTEALGELQIVGKQDNETAAFSESFFDQKDMPSDLPVSEDYKEAFRGFSADTYLVRIVTPGEMGTAEYIVSDDGGNSWSESKKLKTVNHLFNRYGGADANLTLEFSRPSSQKRFFVEGLQFRFDGNHAVEYKGDNFIKETAIGNGDRMPVGMTARELLYKVGKQDAQHDGAPRVDIFDALYQLKENVKERDLEQVSALVGDIDTGIDQLIRARGEIGARAKRLDMVESRLEETNLDHTKTLSDLEDLDLPKAMIDMNAAELQKQVSLDSTKRIIQPSLVQFLGR